MSFDRPSNDPRPAATTAGAPLTPRAAVALPADRSHPAASTGDALPAEAAPEPYDRESWDRRLDARTAEFRATVRRQQLRRAVDGFVARVEDPAELLEELVASDRVRLLDAQNAADRIQQRDANAAAEAKHARQAARRWLDRYAASGQAEALRALLVQVPAHVDLVLEAWPCDPVGDVARVALRDLTLTADDVAEFWRGAGFGCPPSREAAAAFLDELRKVFREAPAWPPLTGTTDRS